MPLLLLIRHGENDYSKTGRLAGRMPGVVLNERGRKQAEELAKALAGAPLAAIYASPLERAQQTAEPIAKARGLKVIPTPGLLEANVGEWQGKSVRRLALSKYWKVVQNSPSRARHPGGESFAETQVRIVSTLDDICARHKDRDLIACVFHSDPIKLAVAHFVGLPLDHFQRLACDTGSVTLLAIGQSSAHLVWLNRRPPFEFPGPPAKK
ncbi:MAG TPA: histidine phosphatase family protein [Anaerolineales bacterium]|nr:histidine phosphatase family protein [Anaerolineales bacterium]